MRRPRTTRRNTIAGTLTLFGASLLLLQAGCAGPAPPEEPVPEPPEGWRVGVAEHIALWYHGLAYVRARDEGSDDVVPRFAPGYRERIEEAKRRLGVYPTVLDRRADELAATLGGEAYRGMAFVPLYFRSGEALYTAIERWAAAGGDPRRAATLEEARIINFLSSLFPRTEQRRALSDWVAVLREEDATFYADYWAQRQPELEQRTAAVQAEWNRLAPGLADYLDYLQVEDGEIFLVPALGAEGRAAFQGLNVPRVAVTEPPADRPEEAVYVFVHELTYPIVQDAIREYLAPVRIREIGEERLAALAAVRGGAILLDETAPERADAYRRYYLRAVGREPAPDAEVVEAFEAAFPLPDDLEPGLRRTIETALAGI